MPEMTLAEKIVQCAKRFDADIVTFGGAARFRGTAAEEICPKLGTVICMGFRVLRGSHLGIEEGSTFYQYTTTGVEIIEETVMPLALLRVSALLEDEGHMAYPQKKQHLVLKNKGDVNPEADWKESYAVPGERQLDFAEAAVLCGAGERGMSGSVLTPEFGPFVRWCFVLTDAVIPETELLCGSLCGKCGACVKACPGHALREDGTRDHWRCAVYYRGAASETNPFMPPEAYEEFSDRESIKNGTAKMDAEKAKAVMDATWFYPPIKQGYPACICGRACDSACYAALEQRGVLTKTYAMAYRRRKWKLS